MKFIAVLGLLIAGASALSVELPWDTCVEDSAATLVTDFTPYPVRIVSGEQLSTKIVLNVLKEIDGDLEVELKMAKKGALFNIPIPCIEISEGFFSGSCKYKVAELLEKYGELLCPDFVPEGQECSLPIKPGTFGGEGSLTLPNIPNAIANLAKGKIIVSANIVKDGSESVACISGVIELTNK
ncbi:uncharacterized protein [Lepeophtheirus salmonis]|uniref:uncharacterized protein n=1 Tax=Lepeophtheirus salmonis TaxID=72036 RepID=UPI001AE3CE11|nr:uncharacterized protein LOC121120620 [Lepeophtheirus salmonis]